MSVATVCRRDVHTAKLGESVRAVAQRMLAHNVGTVVVVDERRRPSGILTDRDMVLRVMAPGKDPALTSVLDVMTPSPRTVTEDTSLETAVGLMRAEQCRRLPVVGRDDELVGVVSLDDVLQLIAVQMGTIGGLLHDEEPPSVGR